MSLVWIGITLLVLALVMMNYRKIIGWFLSIRLKESTTNKLKKWNVKKQQLVTKKDVDDFVKKHLTGRKLVKIITNVLPLIIAIPVLTTIGTTVLKQVNNSVNASQTTTTAVVVLNTFSVLIPVAIVIAVIGAVISWGK
jgi:hypothetical protein